MKELKIGQKAPAFSLPDQDGNKIHLKDFLGGKVAIFFYPKDLTATCTVQACSLRDEYTLLKKQGVEVIGISPDDQKSHLKFIAKNQLPYTLLSDVSLKCLQAYGVWGEKQMYGRKYMGVIRTTFLVNEQGKIVDIIRKVDSKVHGRQILDSWLLS